MFIFHPPSHSPTAGSLALKTPTEEWWCGLCRRTSRSPSRFLRYRYNHTRVFLIFLPCPFLWERISLLACKHVWSGYLSLPPHWLIGGQCLVTAVNLPPQLGAKNLFSSLGRCAPCWLMVFTLRLGDRSRACDSEFSGNSPCRQFDSCSPLHQASTCSVATPLVCTFKFWILTMKVLLPFFFFFNRNVRV